MTFAVAGIAINIFLIGKADNVAADMLKVVSTKKLKGLHEEEIIGTEPAEYFLLKEMDIVLTGFTRKYVTIGLVENVDAFQLLEMSPNIATPIKKASITQDTRLQNTFIFQYPN